jgi:hypothetical protein
MPIDPFFVVFLRKKKQALCKAIEAEAANDELSFGLRYHAPSQIITTTKNSSLSSDAYSQVLTSWSAFSFLYPSTSFLDRQLRITIPHSIILTFFFHPSYSCLVLYLLLRDCLP